MTERLTYREAFFKALEIVFQAADENDFKDVVEELFELLEQLEDVQSVTEFVVEYAHVEGPEALMWAVEFIKKRALEFVKSDKKPEMPAASIEQATQAEHIE